MSFALKKEHRTVTHTPQTNKRFTEKLLQQKAQLEQSMQTAVQEGRQSSTDDLQDAADHAAAAA